MASNELQAEELEVLSSIFNEEELSTETTADGRLAVVVVVKEQGADSHAKSASLRVEFTTDYPDSVPSIRVQSMDLDGDALDGAAAALDAQAQELLGMSMVFSLVETLRQHLQAAAAGGAAAGAAADEGEGGDSSDEDDEDGDDDDSDSDARPAARGSAPKAAAAAAAAAGAGKKVPKDQRSKAAKRRAAQFQGGVKPRGWDWVDLVAHLRKTGGAAAAE